MTTTTITDQLTAITGPQYVRASEDTITVTPANTQQISEILRYANENHLTVTPIGGATKKTWGNSVQAQIHLELTRLHRVLDHPWQDLTCTVQAGCTWQHLQETLRQHGQFVALDPLFPHQATVGGILATNDSGALRHKYGSLRDLVIGMTLVLPDGTIARSGGRVVKNVAGYDLCKLLTGSLGTLAVITEATFRLHPIPQHPQTFTVSAPQAAQLAPLMADIRASHLLTQALQLRGNANSFHLDIQLNAHPEAKQADILQKMTEAAGFKLESVSDEVWIAREVLCSNPTRFLVKITILPEDVHNLASCIVAIGGEVVAQSIGIIYASYPRTDVDFSLFGEIYAFPHGGGQKLLNIPDGPIDESLFPWISIPMPLEKAIKHQFDPNQTLNPAPPSQWNRTTLT